MPPSAPPPAESRRWMWTYAGGLAPVVCVWAVLVGWLATLLYERAGWSDQADAATVREWLDEARNFRKTLPELVREYVRLRDEAAGGPADGGDILRDKRDEVEEQLRSLADPTRAYNGQLPTFPVVYRLEVVVPGPAPADPPGRIVWDSYLPRPRNRNPNRVRVLEYHPLGEADPRAVIRCEYQLHAFNKMQQQEDDRRRVSAVAGAVFVAATLLAGLFVVRFLQRERRREVERVAAVAQAELRRREVLEVRLQQQETERAAEDVGRKLLEQRLESEGLEKRAAVAEKTALEMKSQLYASIGIMAGSYAHNIKNLLVRPNDLLARCLEADGMTPAQVGMLHEVRDTLGTVTERLQQILRTVRRDPGRGEVTRIDLAELARDTARTWADMGRDKWKLNLSADAAGPLPIDGDLSHLQQAIENLVFNARDATFEMRGHFRELARSAAPATRRQRLLEAAGWRGEIALTARRDGAAAVLEVRDNGIGMTAEVRAKCLQTHFTTKRDNALYEGYSAGMGLGLSFVAVVLEHHRAELEIVSEPLKGALFRVRFPAAL